MSQHRNCHSHLICHNHLCCHNHLSYHNCHGRPSQLPQPSQLSQQPTNLSCPSQQSHWFHLSQPSKLLSQNCHIHHKTVTAVLNVTCRPQSNMLKNLPKMLLEISQKFPLLCLDFFLLCSIMLTVIIAVRYVYTHNLYN